MSTELGYAEAHDTSIEERCKFDNWYIDNWSLWLDVKIMVRTLSAVVRGTGA